MLKHMNLKQDNKTCFFSVAIRDKSKISRNKEKEILEQWGLTWLTSGVKNFWIKLLKRKKEIEEKRMT